ncbi:MAG: AarF/ABC1/UbiB kinase family protein [Phycisphaeraceae bacterium]|nr:AarF/ABC1/UbiB kinase family protein [Phycisphaeraceae bacterium]
MDFLHINQTLRNVRRYGEILSTLARHGFGDVIQEMKLDRLVERGVSFMTAGHVSPEFDRLPRAVRLRKAMEELGPTFVKLGQVLSTRPDLVPPEWAEEFRALQDNVPQVPFEEIERRLDQEFGEERSSILRSVQHKALAAASMAQVHRAVLADGTHVVLKILRPGIREQTETDMEIMRALAGWAERSFSNMGYSPVEVVAEFARELAKEVDLTHEGRATERFRAQFKDDPDIVFPEVHWSATTQNVLALEEIKGVLLSRRKPDDLTPEECKKVVANGARAVLRQCLDFGFFHADPHPGNLFALPGGRIAFIDCGMTGQVEARTAQRLAELVSGVVSGETERVIAAVGALGDVDPSILEQAAVRADVRDFVGRFQNVPLDQLDLGPLLRDFFARLRTHRVRCPADLVLLIKALTTIESVGAELDPEFQMVEFARPYVERLVTRRYSLSAIRHRLAASLLGYAELAEDLPGEVRFLLTQVKRNRLAVNLEHRGLGRLVNTIEHASRNVAFALVIASMLVGSSILVLAAKEPGVGSLWFLGVAGFLAATVLAVLMIVSNRRLKE